MRERRTAGGPGLWRRSALISARSADGQPPGRRRRRRCGARRACVRGAAPQSRTPPPCSWFPAARRDSAAHSYAGDAGQPRNKGAAREDVLFGFTGSECGVAGEASGSGSTPVDAQVLGEGVRRCSRCRCRFSLCLSVVSRQSRCPKRSASRLTPPRSPSPPALRPPPADRHPHPSYPATQFMPRGSPLAWRRRPESM